MATGSLTDSPWLFKNYQAIQAFKHTKHRAAFPRPTIPRADFPKATQSETFPKKATRCPTPGSRPQEDRLPEAGLEECRLPEAGQDRTHQDCVHITVIRRDVAAVRPTTPESRSRHGHRAPYGSAISRPARHCSHVDLDVTHDRRQYGPRVAGPFSQRDAQRRPGLP